MASEKIIIKNTQHRKLNYQINFAQALSKMKHRIVCLILQTHDDISWLIKQTIRYLSTTTEPVREGRAATRRLKNIKNDIHFPAYSSTGGQVACIIT